MLVVALQVAAQWNVKAPASGVDRAGGGNRLIASDGPVDRTRRILGVARAVGRARRAIQRRPAPRSARCVGAATSSPGRVSLAVRRALRRAASARGETGQQQRHPPQAPHPSNGEFHFSGLCTNISSRRAKIGRRSRRRTARRPASDRTRASSTTSQPAAMAQATAASRPASGSRPWRALVRGAVDPVDGAQAQPDRLVLEVGGGAPLDVPGGRAAAARARARSGRRRWRAGSRSASRRRRRAAGTRPPTRPRRGTAPSDQ